MAGRRKKLRRVGIIPEYRDFTPDGLASGDAIDMTVDELEVLRLCDLEGAKYRGRQYRVLPHHHNDGRMASKGGRHHEGGNHVRQRQHLYALWPQ